jgi:hypothetical protein
MRGFKSLLSSKVVHKLLSSDAKIIVMMRENWMLGFLGLMGIQGINGLVNGNWEQAVWLVWFVWFIYFMPKKK